MPPTLTPTMQKFILHWGEMGDRWGVNRSVAQINALLYVTGRPMNAEEISESLGIARSNVSTSIRELAGWELIRMVHVAGDRRDHYETFSDPWEMLDRVLDQRRRREIEPTIRLLAECIADAESNPREPDTTRKRLAALHELLVLGNDFMNQLRRLPREPLIKSLKAGGKLKSWLTGPR